MQIATTTLALGANVKGHWGPPAATMQRVVMEINRLGIKVERISSISTTPPMGPVRQPAFLNAAVTVSAGASPAMLMRRLKRLEQAAGRRLGARWGPRPLDIDVITHGGRVLGALGPRTRRGFVAVPHPGMALRPFVLAPMAEVAPHWRHPRTGLTARQMLLRLRLPRPLRPSRPGRGD